MYLLYILLGMLLGLYGAQLQVRNEPQQETFDSPGTPSFYFHRAVQVPSSMFVKVRGVFLSDGLVLTFDVPRVIVYISDLSRLNIRLTYADLPDVTLTSPISLGKDVSISLEITTETVTLVVNNSTIKRTLPRTLDLSAVRTLYVSGSPNISEMDLTALKARYRYVWFDKDIYLGKDL